MKRVSIKSIKRDLSGKAPKREDYIEIFEQFYQDNDPVEKELKRDAKEMIEYFEENLLLEYPDEESFYDKKVLLEELYDWYEENYG